MEKSVLFVLHNADRAGATLLLLNFLRWLKANTDISIQVLVCKGGEMTGEFEKLAPVWRLDLRHGRRAALETGFRKLLWGSRTLSLVDAASRIGSAAKIGLIYSNTVMNGPVVDALSQLVCPVLTHAHELEFAIHTYAAKGFDQVKHQTDCFVAVSEAVRQNLVTRHGIATEKIVCIPGFIPTIAQSEIDSSTFKRSLATELGIPPDARIVGCCGVAYWLKGYDLFVQLAVAIRARALSVPVHFVWLGKTPEGRDLSALRHDLARAGLTDSVHFIGARSEPRPYIAAFDVFALVSREEALSLAMLEAAALGIPAVCFADTGGCAEFIGADAGSVVPYLDIGAMAARIHALLEAPELRATLGQRARERVLARHDLSVVAPRILRIIEQLLGTKDVVQAATRA